MYVLLIIVIFGFYYLLYYTAVLWSERLVLKSTLIYIVSGILFSIPFIFAKQSEIRRYLCSNIVFGRCILWFCSN